MYYSEGKLHIEDFTYMVGFLPRGCKNEQAAACGDTTGILFKINPETYDKEVLYRRIFFEGLYRDKEKRKPYFVVDRTILQE